MEKIGIATLFDITKTNISRGYRPVLAQSHSTYHTEKDWTKARNQQTNFETLVQVISLRANPFDISTPQECNVQLDEFGYHMFKGKCWFFSFAVESDALFRKGDNPVGLLLEDLNNVPMIAGLNDEVINSPHLVTDQEQNNIYIQMVKNERVQ